MIVSINSFDLFLEQNSLPSLNSCYYSSSLHNSHLITMELNIYSHPMKSTVLIIVIIFFPLHACTEIPLHLFKSHLGWFITKDIKDNTPHSCSFTNQNFLEGSWMNAKNLRETLCVYIEKLIWLFGNFLNHQDSLHRIVLF